MTAHNQLQPAIDDQRLSDVFGQLSNDRRRVVIDSLSAADEPLSINDLTREITELEVGDDYNTDERKRVYVGLHQCHLPSLDDAGLINVERDRREISLTERGKTARNIIDVVARMLEGER